MLGGIFASFGTLFTIISPLIMLFYLIKLTEIIKEVYAKEYLVELQKSLLKTFGKLEEDKKFHYYLEKSR